MNSIRLSFSILPSPETDNRQLCRTFPGSRWGWRWGRNRLLRWSGGASSGRATTHLENIFQELMHFFYNTYFMSHDKRSPRELKPASYSAKFLLKYSALSSCHKFEEQNTKIVLSSNTYFLDFIEIGKLIKAKAGLSLIKQFFGCICFETRGKFISWLS